MSIKSRLPIPCPAATPVVFSLLLAMGAITSLLAQDRNGRLSAAPAMSQVQIEQANAIGVPPSFKNAVGMTFVLIPSGSFTMGSPESEQDRENPSSYFFGKTTEYPEDSLEGPQHQVRFAAAFYVSVTEVTQQQYLAVMGRNPSKFKGDNFPVNGIFWSDAVQFCGRLSSLEKGAHKYRLPTEAEWEYACRAGTNTRFSCGDDPNYQNTGDFAWFSGNSRGRPHPVAMKQPNAWGLFDMHGNAAEWCLDFFDPVYYTDSPGDDPEGPTQSSGTVYKEHVMRGGSWKSPPKNLRSAARGHATQFLLRSLSFGTEGFRVVAMITPPK